MKTRRVYKRIKQIGAYIMILEDIVESTKERVETNKNVIQFMN